MNILEEKVNILAATNQVLEQKIKLQEVKIEECLEALKLVRNALDIYQDYIERLQDTVYTMDEIIEKNAGL